MPSVNLSEQFINQLRHAASGAWEPEEHDENYFDAVSCGNGDDSYAAGEEQGAAVMAREVLEEAGLL